MQRVETLIESFVRRTPVSRFIAPERSVRFIEFCLIGAMGTIVDLSITLTLINHIHYLLANVCGFATAITFNFTGNWFLTYDKPNGNKLYQYLSFVGMHVTTFSARVIVIFALVEWLILPPTVATVVGVGVAAVLNFTGNEVIFGGDRRIWLSFTSGVNHLAHAVYTSRLRQWLLRTGIYNVLFGLYAHALTRFHRSDTREIEIGNASATLYTEQPTETVSVYHSLEKEQPVLASFVSDLEPSDTVVDVGANVGVFTVLAGDICDSVLAIEPHYPTAERCSENVELNAIHADVRPIALGATDGETTLSIQNDAVGTQRPTTTESGSMVVPQYRGDDLETPDVLKIDVEGAEHAVLDGYEETLQAKETRIIYVEAHDKQDCIALKGRLESYGYTVELIHTDGEQRYLRGERHG